MHDYFIYGLIDPRTLEVRYVGSSRVGMNRPKAHAHPSNIMRKVTHTSSWIKNMAKDNVTYSITVLEYPGNTKELLYSAEKWWIAYGRCLGWDLTNHTEGGEGVQGKPCSLKTKAKLSAIMKGKRLSPETCAKLSAARKGRKLTDSTKEKLRQSRLGKPRPPEVVAKQAASLKEYYRVNGGRVQSQEEIEKRRKTLFGNTRANSLKGRVFSEETLAKMSEAQQKRRAKERSEQ